MWIRETGWSAAAHHGHVTMLLLYFRHLFQSLGTLDAMFLSDRQQDATEFLLRLLDLFREQFRSSKSDLSLQGWCLFVCQVLLLIPSLLQASEQ
jgi:ubiquitin C-terminal hydrolase